MKPAPQVPTGPIHSFVALAHPLPASAQQRLRQLSAAVHDAEKSANPAAMDTLNDYVGLLRNTIGFEHVRREFLHRGAE
jgi:hypothetical protein